VREHALGGFGQRVSRRGTARVHDATPAVTSFGEAVVGLDSS
jgi:hypothetical protein